ncbi:MAG: HPP family protein [Oscillospiraceae bacterium]|jgi:CBS-domain-containing membrane protein|nr:HPP family protein [Oscillospiraceae bacterium]
MPDLKKLLSTRLDGGEPHGVKHVLLQCALVFGSIGLIMTLYEFFGGIVVASLGASGFILFVTPHTQTSRAINLIGGYVCGSVSGVGFGYLHKALGVLDFEKFHVTLIIGCAAAAAFAMFLMVWKGVVHPPAAALALGLAADAKSVVTAAAAMVGIVILCGVRRLLSKYLKNLV